MSEQLPEQQYPILLTDPRTYQAVSFLIPGRMEDTVMVKNYISSSSKDESLSVDAETFLIAARKWNRDTISVLLDASGSIRPDATVVYNNLESYVRSELRIAAKEHLLRTTCVLISLTLTVCFGAMILNMYRVRFLDEDDPRRKVSFYLRTLLDKVIQRKEA